MTGQFRPNVRRRELERKRRDGRAGVARGDGLDPRDGIARQRLGDALLSMRRYEEAVGTYRAAEGLLGPSWGLMIGQAQAMRGLG
jgi:hypothetical protein